MNEGQGTNWQELRAFIIIGLFIGMGMAIFTANIWVGIAFAVFLPVAILLWIMLGIATGIVILIPVGIFKALKLVWRWASSWSRSSELTPRKSS